MLPMLDQVFMNDNYWTISEIARRFKLTRQAVYVAIKHERLPAIKPDDKHYRIKDEDIKNWRKNRFSRKKSKKEGKLIFGNGWMSVNEAAKLLKVKTQKLYHLMRTGKYGFKYERIGCNYRIKDTDLKDFVNTHMRMFNKRKKLDL